MRLVLASELERAARDVLTAQAWGQTLTVEQFCARELVLRAHPWARASMRTYLWVDDAGQVLASCERFTQRGHLGASPVHASALASVFTAPELRGQGHAFAMLEAVGAVCHQEGDVAVVLFSEIGTRLYERLGFRAVPSFDTCFAAAAREVAPTVHLHAEVPVLEAVTAQSGQLVLTPTAAQLDWHLARERFYGRAQGRTLRWHGASVGRSTLSWTAYFKTGELQVLDARVADDAEATLLVEAARRVAFDAGLTLVRCWEGPRLDRLPEAQRVPRDDEIAMVLPLSPQVSAWVQVQRGLWV
jgi:GNAT superfamily N-acetyltransferase